MNNTHDMKLSNYNKNYYKSNKFNKEEVRQNFVLDCVKNNDTLLFEKLIELELRKIKNKSDIKEYNNIDLLFKEIILYSDYNIWKNILENIDYKSFLRNSLSTAFIFNCQPFLYNIDLKKSPQYVENIKIFSFITLLSYIQKPYCDKKNIYKKANQPDFSFPFYLNFDFDINIDTIIKLEKEKFGKGYSILYLIPNWKKIIDSYFDIFSINLKANDFIEFNKYVKNNGRQNLLALNIDKF